MISEVVYIDAFGYLVLPPNHRAILSGLVSTHESRNSMRSGRPESDLAVGKGK